MQGSIFKCTAPHSVGHAFRTSKFCKRGNASKIRPWPFGWGLDENLGCAFDWAFDWQENKI